VQALEARIRSHEQGIATASATLRELAGVDLPEDPIETGAARAAAEATAAARDEARDARASVVERASQVRTTVTAARAQYAASAGLQEEYAQLRELTNAVQGLEPNTKRMRLETYVLAAQLEEIVAAANARLGAMTHGRFALEHDDTVQYRNARSGLGLAILDQHTGRSRATHSLSGGETFLASLALALGLAEVVQNQAGGITLDTLFIDEGFGSLDSETLETAMATLDGLRAGGRTIGLISHVDTMKEQIHAKLHIRVTDQGHSEISAGRELPAVASAVAGPAVARPKADLVGAAAG
jgi:exonuclease SbcC